MNNNKEETKLVDRIKQIDSYIAFNGNPKVVRLRQNQKYLLLPSYYLIPGKNNSSGEKGIIGLDAIEDETLVELINIELRQQIFVPLQDSTMMYDGHKVRYWTSWHDLCPINKDYEIIEL